VLPPHVWKVESVCRLLALVIIGACAGLLVMDVAADRISAALHTEKRFVLHLSEFVCLHGLALIWLTIFLREHHTTWGDGFGIRHSPGRAIRTGFTAGALALPIAMVVIGGLVVFLMKVFGLAPHVQPAVRIIKEESTVAQTIILGVVAVLLAPIAEESLFRGVLYPAIKQRGHPRLALYGSAVLFGAIHFNVAAFLPLTFLAIVFTWAYERTGNLLAPITSHCLFNAINFWALVHPPKWLEQFTGQ